MYSDPVDPRPVDPTGTWGTPPPFHTKKGENKGMCLRESTHHQTASSIATPLSRILAHATQSRILDLAPVTQSRDGVEDPW